MNCYACKVVMYSRHIVSRQCSTFQVRSSTAVIQTLRIHLFQPAREVIASPYKITGKHARHYSAHIR